MGLFLCVSIALTRCLCSLCSFLQNGNSPSSFSIYIGLSETSQSNSFDSRHRRERSSSDTGHCTAPLIHTHSLVVDRRAPAKVARGCSDGRTSSTSISLSLGITLCCVSTRFINPQRILIDQATCFWSQRGRWAAWASVFGEGFFLGAVSLAVFGAWFR